MEERSGLNVMSMMKQMVEKEPKVKEHLDNAEENISILQVSSRENQ